MLNKMLVYWRNIRKKKKVSFFFFSGKVANTNTIRNWKKNFCKHSQNCSWKPEIFFQKKERNFVFFFLVLINISQWRGSFLVSFVYFSFFFFNFAFKFFISFLIPVCFLVNFFLLLLLWLTHFVLFHFSAPP